MCEFAYYSTNMFTLCTDKKAVICIKLITFLFWEQRVRQLLSLCKLVYLILVLLLHNQNKFISAARSGKSVAFKFNRIINSILMS